MEHQLYQTPAFIREPADEYHAKRATHLTSHQLIDYLVCPRHYKRKRVGLVRDSNPDYYVVGRAAHTLVLEGRRQFEAEYTVGSGPINPKTERPYGSDTQKFRDWAKLQSKPVISDEQYGLICNLEYAVRSHPEAASLLSDGIAEGVLRERWCDHECQVRLDWWSPAKGIVDLKTCLTLDAFEDDARLYHYVHQMAFYAAIVHVATGEIPDVHLIGVEKQEPHRCGIWRIPIDDLTEAYNDNHRAALELHDSVATDLWPTRYEAIRTLTLKKEAA